VEVGLYGKLPSHGDFLRRRTSDAFVDVWDLWLQQCIAASRSALGDRWLDLYLTSPAWRFACAADVCGPATVLGLMVPSVDRVGRYFPLTIVAEAPRELGAFVAASQGAAFFTLAEQLLVDTLAEEEIDFDRFDGRVQRLRESLADVLRQPPVVLDPTAAALLAGPCETGWQMPLGSVEQFASVWSQLVSHRLSDLYAPLSLWWTDGSAAVEPSCLVVNGLPHPTSFKTFLDGSWATERWRTVTATVDMPATSEETLRIPQTVMTCRSAGQTDVGRVRSVNQDAFLERSDIGLWVVADGLGGHIDGDVASRMVCDALADLPPSAALDESAERVRARITEVNEHLLRTSARSLRGGKMGSTVVVLIVRGSACSLLWAGDSRIYRLRDARLQQLTRDHSAAVSVGGHRIESNVVTRAVGVSPGLLLDEIREDVRPGDRFLLCSDGLTRKIPDDRIEAWMQHADIEVAVEGLVDAVLDAGAPDNVTVVIVEALPVGHLATAPI
jgi:type VI secretion system protein ImpM